MEPISAWAAAAGLSWTSGLRLYAVLFIAGGAHASGWIALPVALQPLAEPVVLLVAGSLLVIEFLADKIPYIDSVWDVLHTFVRVPAGALLAAGVFGPEDPGAAVAAGLIGGTLAGGAHLAKAGGRLLINASPEPVSNWTASLGEDALVPVALLIAFKYPLMLLALVLAATTATLWLAPRLVRIVYSFIVRSRPRSRPKPDR